MPVHSVQKAIILAGGRNSRMGALAPKVTLPVANRPNIRRVLEKLYSEGVNEFFVTSHYGSVLDAALEGKNPSMRSIHPILETSPSGTATITRRASAEFDRREPFLVIAADISHPTMKFRSFIRSFEDERSLDRDLAGGVGFMIRPYDEVIGRYPVAIVDQDNRVQKFVERPRDAKEAFRIFKRIKAQAVLEAADKMGIPCLPVNASYYVLLSKVFDLVPNSSAPPSRYDFGKLMFKRMPPDRLFAYFITETVRRDRQGMKKEWIDMASPSDFWRANWLFLKTAAQKLTGSYIHRLNLRVGEDVIIDPAADIKDSVIGDHVRIGPGTMIRHSIIGDNCSLAGCLIEKSVLLPATILNLFGSHSALDISESVVGARTPLLLLGDEAKFSVRQKLVTTSGNGEILVQPLDIKPGESELASDCFNKLKFPNNFNEIVSEERKG